MTGKKIPDSQLLENHFREPRNTEPIAAPTHVARVTNPVCDDELHLQVQVEKNSIARAAFQARACWVTVALASVVTEKVRGRPLQEIFSWSEDLLWEWAGRRVKGKEHAAELILLAFREAVK